MGINKKTGSGLLAAILVGGGLFTAFAVRSHAETVGESAKISGLLKDAKTEAAALKTDTEEMLTFTRSKVSWQSHAAKVEMVKEHINKAGEIAGKLTEAQSEGAPWQQQAIVQIPVLLRELATNTEAMIEYLNKNQNRVHHTDFQDYVKTNSELASELSTLINEYVSYGTTKARLEDLSKKLEVE